MTIQQGSIDPVTLALVGGAAVVTACVRCAKPLTDPASSNAGIGPDCRGKASGLLAKEFRGAFSGDALLSAMALSPAGFPDEAAPLVARVADAVIRTKAFLDNGAGEDCRELVRELTALAAYTRPNSGAREQLFGIMRGLGYAAYVGYLEGATIKPMAVTVGCDVSGAYVTVPAPRKIEARAALGRIPLPTRYGIPSIGEGVFLRPRHMPALAEWCAAYAPMTRIDLIAEQLTAIIESRGRALRPVCRITQEGARASVKTPERNETVISWLKSRGARWNPTAMAWEMSALYIQALSEVAGSAWEIRLDAE